SSSRIALMSAEEERGYLRLLLHAWKQPDCGLPNDDATLAVLAMIPIGKWRRSSGAKLRQCFELRDGRLYNQRLLRERQHQDEYKRERSEAGRKGAEKRWSIQQVDGSASSSGISSANGTAIVLPSKNGGENDGSGMARGMANGWQTPWQNDASPSPSLSDI